MQSKTKRCPSSGERGKIPGGGARYALNDWQGLADAICDRKAVADLLGD